MLTIAPFAGVGLGMTEAVVGSFVIGASGEKANVYMSRVETFFGVGALIIPFAGAALIEAGQWKLSFGIVGAMSAATFVLWPSGGRPCWIGPPGRATTPLSPAPRTAGAPTRPCPARAGRAA